MDSFVTELALSIVLVVVGIAIGAIGVYVGETDDVPGALFVRFSSDCN